MSTTSPRRGQAVSRLLAVVAAVLCVLCLVAGRWLPALGFALGALGNWIPYRAAGDGLPPRLARLEERAGAWSVRRYDAVGVAGILVAGWTSLVGGLVHTALDEWDLFSLLFVSTGAFAIVDTEVTGWSRRREASRGTRSVEV